MTERQTELFNLINKYPDITLKELAILMHLSEKQTYQRILQLDKMGYKIRPKYYETGDIGYMFLRHYGVPNKLNIYTDPNNRSFRALFTGDTHYGHETENLIVTEAMFDYAIKNDIHTICHTGDIFVQKYLKDNTEDYLNYVCKKYPYDKSITTFIVHGNHEYDGYYHNALDSKQFIKNKRYDIVSLGYQTAKIVIKNDVITLHHPISLLTKSNINGICFRGHSHASFIHETEENLIINVPACSNANRQSLPGILDVTLHFADNGLINQINSTTLMYTSSLIKVHEFKKEINIKVKSDNYAKNEEIPKHYVKDFNC